MTVQGASGKSAIAGGWRTPVVIVIAGCLIGMISFGPRSSLGFFLTPLSQANHWGRDVFAFALAIQNLLWGIGQPFAGAIADRFGAPRVLSVGAVLYAAGLYLMASATTPTALTLSAGVLIGFGLSGCSFTIVVGAFGKLLPPEWRSIAFGFGTAAGSFGQFLFSPLAVALMDKFGWHVALAVFAGLLLLIVPLSVVLAAPRSSGPALAAAVPTQSVRQAMAEAFGHRSYVLLVLGFFTCGFQLAFTTVHLPAYLLDRGLSAEIGGWTLATIGLFNIIGSVTSGYLGSRMPKRYILSVIYFARAISIAVFIMLPASPDRDVDLRRRHRPVVALHGAADVGAGGGDVRHALAGHAVRLCLLQPPGRRLPRRLARRPRVRPLRLLQSGVVAGGIFRRGLGDHQSADRRGAGRPAGAVGGLTPCASPPGARKETSAIR